MVSVHNVNELAKVKKFQYLLTSLKGEALDLVKGLDITDSNYDVAWEILCQRFQCERRHIFHHFNGLLDLPEVKDVQQIPALLTKYREHTQALEGLDHKLSEYSSMLTAVMVQKLNNYFRKRFDDFRGTETKYPTIDSLVDFLEKECLQLDGSAAKSTKPKHKQPPSKQTLTASVKPKQSSSQQKCPCCTQDHPIYFCESFLAKSIPERRSFVKEKNLCFNCMKFNHSSSVCKNQYTCKTCHKRHNSLLHLEDTSNQDSSKPPKTAMVSNSKPKEYACILGTALVLVKDSFGGYQPVRGLIDSAAMSTFITKRCANKLGLKIHKEAPPISGLGNQAVNDIHGTVECEIKSRIESQPVFTSTATIMTKITTDLPNISLPNTMSKPLRTLILADPEWMKPGPVDLLIGADLYPHIYDGRKIILDENWPIALSSIYGWVMTGKFSAPHDATRIAAVTTSESAPITALLSINSEPIETCLRRHWEIEEPPSRPVKSPNDLLAEELFVEKHARDEIIECAGECNMELKKWSSNDPEILEDLPESNLKTPVEFSDADSSESLLGLQWQPSSDIFSFKVEKITPVYTKRGIASVVAQIFDPLGLISPIMLKGKQFLQQLWLLGIDWDEAVPLELQAQWKKYTEELIKISEIRIPRHVSLINGVKFDLVGFSDASKLGYSGNVYLRVESSSGEVKTSLLMAKTKVAPLKPMSIPRLELQGAALLTELLDAAHYICSMAHPIRKVFAYSDSTVVLSWLQTPPYRLKVFVANRVTRILEVLTPQHWGHVKSEDNPSDLASRGCMPDRLADNSLWWHGPKWLQEPEEKWPKLSPFDPESKAEIIDKLPDIVTLVQNKQESWEETFLKSFSGFVPLLRTTVWMLRFTHNTRHPSQKRTGQISSAELQEARHWWIKIIQGKEFKSEIKTLSEKKESPASLCKLRPFLDEQGLLRVGGRLRHSDMSYDFKFPILLPKNHHFTRLVIDYYHDMTLHGGPSSTLAAINQRFWIINGRAVVRSKLQKCIQCFKVRPKFTQPLMGDLPKWRVQAAYPFLNTACDYGGPFQVKENKLRNARQTKGYLALFICMATKAVHLEFVSELTTKAFEGALARFVSRRGLCKNMFSDNGTNFVGMNNSLKELYAFLKTNETSIAENLSKKEINWHFQPASAPNFGGLHEAGIKSAKHHLKRIMGTQIFTFEEMTTLVTRVEAIMNSRPLCPLSTDPSDMDALTPGHFLVGRPLNALPEENLTETPSNRVDRWGLINKASQHFWQTWKNEYINCLRQRSKWTQETDPIKIDDLVIIQDNNLPPQQWRLGRITKCFPGPDDVTRVVDVKTTTGTLRRPVSKLCRLPISSDKDQ
ncbi:uncharacterized protein [Bemisia tabaci]|uniref:uncharacterized protein n=1 Tax=Bemisia tabaci TaxID=7038 RepID=UPI003B282665